MTKNKNSKSDLNDVINSIIISSYIPKILDSVSISLFGTEEEKQKLKESLDKDRKKLLLAKENNEKGLLPYFDSSLEPISQEFGCPYCGEYCYPVNYTLGGSHCESECEFSGQTLIYCPKKKCRFELFCQSTMVPLGMILDENSRYGYQKDESFTISYRNKLYTFSVKSEYLTAGMISHFIHAFINYDLPRKEIGEYVWLESVNEIN